MARRALGPATLEVVQAVGALDAASWLIACSGGADSLALAWAAHHVGERDGVPVRAVVIDHGLQTGSDAVAAGVLEVLRGFALEAESVRVEVRDEGAGPEASARAARYAALSGHARPGEVVLLGHTLDDQAETVLLGLARGAGVRSLAGMEPRRGLYVRPLLAVTRATTAAACAEVGLVPWHDPMNGDHRYARVRAREVVLPVLEEQLGPGIRESLARTAALCREASAAMGVLAGEVDPERRGDCLHLAGLDPGVRRAVLHDWLLAAGASGVTSVHVAAVERLVTHWRGQKGVDVPGGRVRRRDGRLMLDPPVVG